MNNAGRSAAARAAQLRRRRGWLRRILTWLGLLAPPQSAAAWDAGAAGERMTAALLQPLQAAGWHILHDRAIPGSRANVDHILAPPHARYLIVLDSKLWSKYHGTVCAVRGRLFHGDADRHDRSIRAIHCEASHVRQQLGVPVVEITVVHSAPVDRGGFRLDGVLVIPAERLLPELRRHARRHPADPARAGRLAREAAGRFPPYRA